MIFSLGFLIAGLLSLLFLPAFWRRAMRLSMRRLEMLTPLSMAEVLAERDQLRAHAAVELRRVEQKLEAAQQDRARAMSEIGRRAGIIARLEGVLERFSTAEHVREAELRSAWAELALLHADSLDLTSRLRKTDEDLLSLRVSQASLQSQYDALRLEKTALEASLEELRSQEQGLRQALVAIQRELDAKDALARQWATERDAFRDQAEKALARGDQLAAAMEEQRARMLALETSERLERRARLSAEKDLEVVTNKVIADARAVAAQPSVSQGSRRLAFDAASASIHAASPEAGSAWAADQAPASLPPLRPAASATGGGAVMDEDLQPEAGATQDQINILRVRAGLRAAAN